MPSHLHSAIDSPLRKQNDYCVKKRILILAVFLIVIIIIITIVLSSIILFSTVPIPSSKLIRPLRLPENVIPEHYVLEVQPYLIPDYLGFDGYVVITILCVISTKELILHSKDLQIDQNRIELVNLDNGYKSFVLKIKYDIKNEFVIFDLCEHLQEGTKYNIQIWFSGKFAEDLFGFGRITYEMNGETKHMALTKFQSVYARKAFPCFDEPALKATFNINLVRWKNMTSLSNMNKVKTVERDEDWETDVYERSVPMSTYLVTFVIGDLEKIQKGKVSIWAAKDVESYRFALNVTYTLLEFYESYLQVPYSIPKLDQLAAEDYSTSAMENWGLIIYYKDVILSGKVSNESVAMTVSHELAHQWFGNLVTMKWWDQIWLSEGFASYFAFHIANIVNQEWKMEEDLILFIENTMNEECNNVIGPNIPLVEDTESTEKVKQYLNTIVYGKGAALLRMMHMILGDVTFRKGIKSYLRKNAFRNVDQEDLWKHLTKAQRKKKRRDMKPIMEPWTRQSYFPLVTVTREYNDNKAIVEQTSCANALGMESKDLWPVPITWITGIQGKRNTTVKLFLNSQKGIIHNLPGEKVWILVNVNHLGYFRVNYDEKNWKLLLQQLWDNFMVIPTLNRYQLISDSLHFAKINQLSHVIALNILSYYQYETEDMVLKALMLGEPLHYYGNMVKYSNVDRYWKEFIHYLLKPLFDRSTWIWKEETISKDGYFNWLQVGILCYEGYFPCLLAARTKFKDVLEGKPFPQSFTSYALKNLFCALARIATEEEWTNMNESFKGSYLYKYTAYLACTENDELFERWVHEYFFSVNNMLDLSIRLSEERWSYITSYLRTHWNKINQERSQEILRNLVNQPHNKETLKMIKEIYELHKSDLSKDTKEEIDRVLSAKTHLMPSPDAIRSVSSWLRMRNWERIQ